MDPQVVEENFETVTVDESGKVIQRVVRSARMQVFSLGGEVTLEMAAVPGGMFQMGSPPNAGFADERPRHITIVEPCLMGRFLITQEQWGAVMKKRPPFRSVGPRKPVENVSWFEAQEFCERLSKFTHQPFRLPSEAQWESACRAGTATPFYFGDTITTDLANYCGDYTFRSEPKGVYRHGTTDVGVFPPNTLGLYDLHGNLWEWCADSWHPDYQGAPPDGSAWVSGRGNEPRVLRGGSWHEPPDHCRSAVRLELAPGERDDFFGFRVAL